MTCPAGHFLRILQPFVDLRLTATKNPRSSWCKNLPPPSHYRRITFPVAKLDSGKKYLPLSRANIFEKHGFS